MRYELKIAAAAALALMTMACKGADAGTLDAGEIALRSPDVAPTLLEVTARDFAFEARRTTPAGVTNVRLTNLGPDFHHVQLVRLSGGHTVEELVEQAKTDGEHLPAWAIPVGGPNSPAPGGGVAEAIVDLQPGEHALICLIPAPDGVLHLMKGMVVPLTVTSATGTIAAVPTPDVEMRLNDYSFTVSTEVAAGRRTIRVRNDAEQPHEVFIAKLAPGKNAGDLLTWMQKMDGPPPALPIGGVSFLATGEENYLTLDLEPGEYGLYCFVPDAADRRPHFMHGMIRQISVK